MTDSFVLLCNSLSEISFIYSRLLLLLLLLLWNHELNVKTFVIPDSAILYLTIIVFVSIVELTNLRYCIIQMRIIKLYNYSYCGSSHRGNYKLMNIYVGAFQVLLNPSEFDGRSGASSNPSTSRKMRSSIKSRFLHHHAGNWWDREQALPLPPQLERFLTKLLIWKFRVSEWSLVLGQFMRFWKLGQLCPLTATDP